VTDRAAPILEHMHKLIQSLGPVWEVGFDDDEPVVLEPGGPFYTDEQISAVERELGYRLPLEYRFFLVHYGSPSFFGYKLMTVYPDGHHGDLPPSDDILSHYRLNTQNGLLRAGDVAFLETDEKGVFFYRCQPLEKHTESPSSVYRVFGNDMERECVAPSMLALLARWVVESDDG
jgi:hypothetical protein